MKKGLKGLGLSLCALMLLAGCSCNKDGDDSVKANINNGNNSIVSGLVEGTKNITLQNLYDDLKAQLGNEQAANKLLEIIAESEIFNNETWKKRYDAKIKEKKLELVNDSAYQVNGEFSEKLLVAALKAQLYNIDCGANPVYGPTYEDPTEEDDPENVVVKEYLLCDYSDYEDKALKLSVIDEILKEKYIYDEVLEDKPNLLNTKKARIVEYISISSGEEFSFEFISDAVKKLQEGKSLEYIAGEWEKRLIKELKVKYNKIGTKDDSTGTIWQEFTNGYKYDKEEGLRLKMQEIYGVDYYNNVVITSDSKEILNTTLVDRILSENVIPKEGETDAKKTFKINDNYYLVSPLAGNNVDADDIRITDKTNSKYYLIKVEKVEYDAEETDAVKLGKVYDAIKVLAKNNSLVSNSVNYYIEKNKNNISVHDEEIYAYLKTQYADIFVD